VTEVSTTHALSRAAAAAARRAAPVRRVDLTGQRQLECGGAGPVERVDQTPSAFAAACHDHCATGQGARGEGGRVVGSVWSLRSVLSERGHRSHDNDGG
jgi:hypothetical protein